MSKELKAKLLKMLRGSGYSEPKQAYDLWAPQYDNQRANLMLDQDEMLFSELFSAVDAKGKNIVDFGCGTGRHWQKIFDRQPASLEGFDVSENMLSELKKKFPNAQTQLLSDLRLTGISNASVDLNVSTLTIAHLEDLDKLFN